MNTPTCYSVFSGSSLTLPPGHQPTIDDFPPDEVAGMAARLLMLLNLAWDYVETIQQIAGLLEISDTRRVSRRVNELRRAHYQRLSYSLNGSDIDGGKKVALLFESVCSEHLRKFHWAIINEIKREHPALESEYADLLEAVYTAMTVLESAMLFGKECDGRLRAHGVKGNSTLTPEVRELSRLLPLFAGDCYNPHSQVRTLTARILLNEVKGIDLVDEHGKEF